MNVTPFLHTVLREFFEEPVRVVEGGEDLGTRVRPRTVHDPAASFQGAGARKDALGIGARVLRNGIGEDEKGEDDGPLQHLPIGGNREVIGGPNASESNRLSVSRRVHWACSRREICR